MFVLVNGFGLAAVTAHLAGWPTRRTRIGLPWLRDCEGLGPELMRYYNPVLYLSAAACATALVRENRTAPRRLALVPLALVPLLAFAQHAEHGRLRRLAARSPAWWNRRLAG
jgi:peptidoglycan/LPS O-acetylase OafA/YrhL